jgi:1-acyl-sn-glycerol-3-phosphate acyltransferase
MRHRIPDQPLRPVAAVSRNDPALRAVRGLTFLRHVYEYGVLYCGLLLFGLSFFAWSLAATVLRPLLPRRFGARLGQSTIMWLFRACITAIKASGIVKIDLSALDTLRDEGPLIIAPNHPSMLDAVLVVSRLPRVACIMKASIWDNLILGGGARFAAYIRDDCPFTMIRAATTALRAGGQLLMFPEGTRTRQNGRYHFKGGFAFIAKTARVPVQTVFIETNSPFLGKGWSLFKKPAFPLIYRARLGRRYEVDGAIKPVVRELENYFRDTLSAGPAAHARDSD